jgi:transcriptional regulator with XRE-family HTH domain
MAKLVGVDPTTLSRFEAGKRISMRKQRKILKATTKLSGINQNDN